MDSIQYLKLHTLQLVSFDKEKQIQSLFSGCLLLFRNFTFIISVAHGLKNNASKVAIIMHNIPQLYYLPNWKSFNPTRLRQFRTKFNIYLSKIFIFVLKLLKIKNDYMSILFKYIGGIDFISSIIFLEYIPIHSLPVNSDLVGLQKQPFYQRQIEVPNDNDTYNFYGLTNFRMEKGNFLCEEIFVTKMKYIKTEYYYHVFKLNRKYRNLKGCSGSPIIDDNGNSISIVVKKHKYRDDIIYGINFKLIEILFHHEINSMTGEQIYE